jgi:hypothetical protein
MTEGVGASARDWADGYLGQARADLRGAHAVSGAEPSVLAMLLQMLFEKFAKAALLRLSPRGSWARGCGYPTTAGGSPRPFHDPFGDFNHLGPRTWR